MQSTLEKQAGFTLATWQHRPESSGYVRAKSPNPFQHPEIQPNYLAAETDRRVILSAIKICRRLAQTDALKPFVSEETFPGVACKTDDELLNSAREIGQSIYHLMGTCRMGRREDQSSVVDEKLRVHGIKNLRVIDASIMPTMVSANLNAAAMMIAEKGADMVLENRRNAFTELYSWLSRLSLSLFPAQEHLQVLKRRKLVPQKWSEAGFD